MGRRSINTTKSGKFMNPTDQARKEARKKELKKNKKQRQMVRAAVLKGKDPNHLIGEMEKIDRMEYDVNNPPQLNEKVLKDKRKKLRETFIRVLRLYEKEDPEQWRELRRLDAEYETRRMLLVQYYESVKYAQHVQVEDIPLPSVQMPSTAPSQIPLPSEIPLPTIQQTPHSILKKPSLFAPREINEIRPWSKFKAPPGVPPGPPPELSDCEEEEPVSNDKEKTRKIRFADDPDESEREARMTILKSLAQMRDPSEVEKLEKELMESRQAKAAEDSERQSGTQPMMIPGMMPPSMSGLPPGPPPMMFRPPPLRPGMPPPPPIRLPPGPPPGRPPGSSVGLPLHLMGHHHHHHHHHSPMRMPPGPPPGMPPQRLMRSHNMPPSGPPPGVSISLGSMASSLSNSNVVSAPPSLVTRPKSDDEPNRSATFEGKPQIRNLSAEITRFMPTSLRVKREDRGKKREQRTTLLGVKADDISVGMVKTVPVSAAPMKDDAYELFMREMEGLL